MKFLPFLIATALLSAIFTSCEKDKIPELPPAIETPAPQVQPVTGNWTGVRIGLERSIPFYFNLKLKTGGKLDLLDKDKQLIARGTWSFDNEVLRIRCSLLSSGETYLFVSNFYNANDVLAGTWGHDDNDRDGGQWQLTRVD
jgi:hypothetical protein